MNMDMYIWFGWLINCCDDNHACFDIHTCLEIDLICDYMFKVLSVLTLWFSYDIITINCEYMVIIMTWHHSKVKNPNIWFVWVFESLISI